MKNIKLYIAISVALIVLIAFVSVRNNIKDSSDKNTQPEEADLVRTKASRSQRKEFEKWMALTDMSRSTKQGLELAVQIDPNTTPDELEYILSQLHFTPDSSKEERWWVVFNEIIEQIRKKNIAPDRLRNELEGIIRDEKNHEVVRDYAVQHLALMLLPDAQNKDHAFGQSTVKNSISLIMETAKDGSISHTSVPGTSIASLTHILPFVGKAISEPAREELDAIMDSFLQESSNATVLTKLTAINCSALLRNDTVLPEIRRIARDETADASMRLSSIAALGTYRSMEDHQYILSLANGESGYRYAAREALRKLSN